MDKAAAVRVFRGLGARVERAELLALSEAFGVVFPDGAVNPVTGRLRPHEMLAYPLLLMAVEGGAEDLAHRFHSRFACSAAQRQRCQAYRTLFLTATRDEVFLDCECLYALPSQSTGFCKERFSETFLSHNQDEDGGGSQGAHAGPRCCAIESWKVCAATESFYKDVLCPRATAACQRPNYSTKISN